MTNNIVNSFAGGIDTDTTASKRNPSTYYDAENLRKSSYDALDNESLTNILGTRPVIELTLNTSIKKALFIEDTLFLFARINNDSVIYKATLSGDTLISPDTVYSDSLFNPVERMYFTDNITAVAIRESDNIYKLYWSDTDAPIRSISINADNSLRSPMSLDIVPLFNQVDLSCQIIQGGEYNCGIVTYAYQLCYRNGSSTTISSETERIHLTSVKFDEIGGGDLNQNANKSIRISANIPSYQNYDLFRLIAIFYETIDSEPTINIVAEIPLTSSNVVYVDSGSYIGQYTLEEFRILGITDVSAKSLDHIDNRLFAANITEKTFSSSVIDEWDSRAYRFATTSGIDVSADLSFTNPPTVNANDPLIFTLSNDTQISMTGVVIPQSVNTSFKVGFNDVVQNWTFDGTTVIAISAYYDPDYDNVGTFPEFDISLGDNGTNEFIVKGATLEETAQNYLSKFTTVFPPSTYEYTTSIWEEDNAWHVQITFDLGVGYINIQEGNYQLLDGNSDVIVSVLVEEELIISPLTLLPTEFGIASTPAESMVNMKNRIIESFGQSGTVSQNNLTATAITNIDGVIGWKIEYTPEDNEMSPASIVIDAQPSYFILISTNNPAPISYVAGRAVIYESNDYKYVISPDGYTIEYSDSDEVLNTLSWDQIPELSDAINRYNMPYTYGTNYYPYKYRSDLSTIGGDGPNVAYWFESSQKNLYENGRIDPNTSYIDSECMPGEVYRVGIRFLNKKGQSSFVKWVGDIMFESATDVNNRFFVNSYSRRLVVNIKNLPVDDSIASWQVVRCKMSASDRSVIASGFASVPVRVNVQFYRPTSYLNETAVPSAVYQMGYPIKNFLGNKKPYDYTIPAGEDFFNDKLYELYCPEMLFDKNFESKASECKVRVVGLYNVLRPTLVSKSGAKFANMVMEYSSSSPSILNTPDVAIVDGRTFEPQYPYSDSDPSGFPLRVGNNSINYLNELVDTYSNGTDKAGRCTGYVFTTSAPIASCSSPDDLDYHTIPQVQLFRNIDFTRYSGITYYARTLNTYISFSNVESIGQNASCNNGNVYPGIFTFIRGLFYDKSGDAGIGIEEIISVAVMSPIDVNRRSDNIHKLSPSPDSFTSNSKSYRLQETVAKGIELYPLLYPSDVGNLYRYNSVYSREADSTIALPKPINWSNTTTNQLKVIASEKKINGEINDSWTVFPPNNFLEVESKHGDITSIKVFKDKLFCFQKNGIGVIANNERSIISDNNIGSLALGSGSILDRIDYISEQDGARSESDIVASNYNLYLYSSNDKSIIAIPSMEKISITKNFSSLMRGLNDSVIAIGVDNQYNEILFTIGDKTIALNERDGRVFSRYSFTPKKYFYNNKFLLSYIENENIGTDRYIFSHNTGERCSFYPEVRSDSYKDSTLTTIVNPYGKDSAMFNVVEFKTESEINDYIVEKVEVEGRLVSGLNTGDTMVIDKVYDKNGVELSFSEYSKISGTLQDGTKIAYAEIGDISNSSKSCAAIRLVTSAATNFTVTVVFNGGKKALLFKEDSATNGEFYDIDILELLSSKFGSSPSGMGYTFSDIEFSNSYISPINVPIKTISLDKNTSNLVRSFRTQVPLTQKGNRLVDSYLKIKFIFKNKFNSKLRIHDITTKVMRTKK